MKEYIVRSSHLIPSKVKGELPEVVYNYIANDSSIGIHYTLTRERDYAYIFVDYEKKDAEFIAECWGMKLVELI
ncbi:hypothetical protein [Alkalihalobacillus pseudalcaliphilus]|uniref:hypothetical protein n=1 Tax=Alkalihalobacillus pseudalcaliphilus TaxID=79884 RepID=UPI00064DE56A|nr:hypothetical protein [Alkalihalobacillus pseudalcaliphilus]KMK77609.1 hypothetical protein AB990_03870 [Alkalihalobacillus pseudalcaliphilus]